MLKFSLAGMIAFVGFHPLLQAGTILVGTFVLEDAATVCAAMQAQSGALSLPLALGALYLGIVLGDLGLYGLGASARRVPPIQRLLPPKHTATVRAWLAGKVIRVVLIARFLPGARLPTYTTCGYLRADLLRFSAATLVGTGLWTIGLFWLTWRLGDLMAAHLAEWRWACGAGLVLVLVTAGRLWRSRIRTQTTTAPGTWS